MFARVKLTKIRIHLPSGDFFEAEPGEVSTSPALGAYMTDPRTGAQMPIAPVVVVLHLEGSATQRRFFGAALELIEEEQIVEEVGSPIILPRGD